MRRKVPRVERPVNREILLRAGQRRKLETPASLRQDQLCRRLTPEVELLATFDERDYRIHASP